MEETTRFWLDDAEYDIKSAAENLRTGRYFFVVLMCHMALEKTLKAVWTETLKTMPPKTHSLSYLAEKALKDKLPDCYQDFIDELSNKSVVTRYPEGRRALADKLNADTTKQILNTSQEVTAWIIKNCF